MPDESTKPPSEWRVYVWWKIRKRSPRDPDGQIEQSYSTVIPVESEAEGWDRYRELIDADGGKPWPADAIEWGVEVPWRPFRPR